MGWRERVGLVQSSGFRTFPEAYSYTPAGGVEVSGLTGIFRDESVQEPLGGERDLVSQKPTLDVRLSDLGGSVDRGDLIAIDRLSRTFEIHDSQEDGEGLSTLVLLETS